MNAHVGLSWSDTIVHSAEVPIAVRDYGGAGTDVILLHGGTRSMEDWDSVVPLLVQAGLRVVTVDMRGHGRSGKALWSWTEAATDISAVIAELGLREPALVGHSLGGILAAVWAAGHPECPLAVNLDGRTNPTTPEQYSGVDAEAAHSAIRASLDAELAEADDPELTRLVEALDTLDLLAVYRATKCPLVVVATYRRGAEERPLSELGKAFKGYQTGFKRDLAATAAVTPLLSLVEIDSGHEVHLEKPSEVASVVIDHLPL
jgi:pimeloyl-ACP methyl ester carboxylesterase